MPGLEIGFNRGTHRESLLPLTIPVVFFCCFLCPLCIIQEYALNRTAFSGGFEEPWFDNHANSTNLNIPTADAAKEITTNKVNARTLWSVGFIFERRARGLTGHAHLPPRTQTLGNCRALERLLQLRAYIFFLESP